MNNSINGPSELGNINDISDIDDIESLEAIKKEFVSDLDVSALKLKDGHEIPTELKSFAYMMFMYSADKKDEHGFFSNKSIQDYLTNSFLNYLVCSKDTYLKDQVLQIDKDIQNSITSLIESEDFSDKSYKDLYTNIAKYSFVSAMCVFQGQSRVIESKEYEGLSFDYAFNYMYDVIMKNISDYIKYAIAKSGLQDAMKQALAKNNDLSGENRFAGAIASITLGAVSTIASSVNVGHETTRDTAEKLKKAQLTDELEDVDDFLDKFSSVIEGENKQVLESIDKLNDEELNQANLEKCREHIDNIANKLGINGLDSKYENFSPEEPTNGLSTRYQNLLAYKTNMNGLKNFLESSDNYDKETVKEEFNKVIEPLNLIVEKDLVKNSSYDKSNPSPEFQENSKEVKKNFKEMVKNKFQDFGGDILESIEKQKKDQRNGLQELDNAPILNLELKWTSDDMFNLTKLRHSISKDIFKLDPDNFSNYRKIRDQIAGEVISSVFSTSSDLTSTILDAKADGYDFEISILRDALNGLDLDAFQRKISQWLDELERAKSTELSTLNNIIRG